MTVHCIACYIQIYHRRKMGGRKVRLLWYDEGTYAHAMGFKFFMPSTFPYNVGFTMSLE